MSEWNVIGPLYVTDVREGLFSEEVISFVRTDVRTGPSVRSPPGPKIRGDDRLKASYPPAAGPGGDGGASCSLRKNAFRTHREHPVRNHYKGFYRAHRALLCFLPRPLEEMSSAAPMLLPKKTHTAGTAATNRKRSISNLQEE